MEDVEILNKLRVCDIPLGNITIVKLFPFISTLYQRVSFGNVLCYNHFRNIFSKDVHLCKCF